VTQRRRSSRAGFTLVELLVVMAIIGILAAILLPSLGKARARAKMITCRANLNQIGKGLLAYAGEYSNLLPDWGALGFTGGSAQDAPSQPCWHTHLYVYGYIDDEATFVCPAADEHMQVYAANKDKPVSQRQPIGLQRGAYGPLAQPHVVTYMAWEDWSSWHRTTVDSNGQPRQNIDQTMWKRNYNPIGRPGDERLAVMYDGYDCFTSDAAHGVNAWQWTGVLKDHVASARHPGGGTRPGDFNILWLDSRVSSYTDTPIVDAGNFNRFD